MKKTDGPPVLVPQMNHGTVGVARSLGRLGVPVFAMGDDPGGIVSSSRYLRGTFPWSLSTASGEETIEALLEVGARLGERPILMVGRDDLALLVAEHADRLAERFLFPRVPRSLVASMADKRALHDLCLRHGIPTPAAAFPASADEAVEMARSLGYPIMLKGIDGLALQRRTGIKMTRVDSPDEMARIFPRLNDPSDPNLMLQEYVPGGDDSVYMFNGYFDAESRCLFGLAGRKIHQHPPHRGATSLGVVVENPRVRKLTLDLVDAVGYRGILDIGFRYDARDDSYKLLDPNPRLGCTFRLFVDRRGSDVVRALYRDLTGEPVPSEDPAPGRGWMKEDAELDSIREYRREGILSWGRLARELAGVRELAWWALDDPMPAVRCAARRVSWLARRVFDRRSPGPDAARNAATAARAVASGQASGEG